MSYWTSSYINIQTVRDTLKDANEINEYKAKELNEKVKISLKSIFLLSFKEIIISVYL